MTGRIVLDDHDIVVVVLGCGIFQKEVEVVFFFYFLLGDID